MSTDTLLGLQQNESSYPHLDLSSNSFRLLSLLPDPDPSSMIRCQLFTADQANYSKKYIACSYTWGPPEPVKSILLNGRSRPVRKNCYDLLRACRQLSGPPLILWIDALCINQSSTSEKNHQVAQMGKIYGRARMVCSWLGLGDADVEWLFDQLNSKYPSGSSPFVRQPSNVLNRMLAASTLVASMEYWTRLWVVQEVVNATTIVIFYGKKELPWQSLADHFNSLNTMMAASYILLCCFRWEHHMSCELPLDKVYALYGMQRMPELQHALVDYHQDPWNLLCELVRQCRLDWPLEFVYTFICRLGLNAETVIPQEAASRKLQISLRDPETFSCLYSHYGTFTDCTWEESCMCRGQSEAFADEKASCAIHVYASPPHPPHLLQGLKVSGRSALSEYLLVDATPASKDPSAMSSSAVIGIGSHHGLALPSSCSDKEHRSFSECIKQLSLTSVIRTDHKNGYHVLETTLLAFVSLTFNLAPRPRDKLGGVTRGEK